MKIAVPSLQGKLSNHFGHCQYFSILDVEDGKIVKEEQITPPPHEPGVLPKFLHDLGVNMIIAGGMGQRAQTLFAQNDIQVYVGVPQKTPQELVQDYLKESLVQGENLCDH